jgi:hypothetical protein
MDSQLHKNSFTPLEIEFIAENDMIDIIPFERMEAIHLICVFKRFSSRVYRVTLDRLSLL